MDTETTTEVMTTEPFPSTTELQFETKHANVDHEDIFESADMASSKQTPTATFTTVFKSVLANQIENTCTIAWILFAMMSILFSGSLTINMIVLAFLVYKKRQVGGEKGQRSEFEIEGNPCYETTEMKQSCAVESEAHVYETVREKRAK